MESQTRCQTFVEQEKTGESPKSGKSKGLAEIQRGSPASSEPRLVRGKTKLRPGLVRAHSHEPHHGFAALDVREALAGGPLDLVQEAPREVYSLHTISDRCHRHSVWHSDCFKATVLRSAIPNQGPVSYELERSF